MKEILYKYNNSGSYFTDGDTSFGDESIMKLIIEPHKFSITVGDEVLRSTSFDGCTILVYNNGKVCFYNKNDEILGKADGCDKLYKEINFVWKQDCIFVLFGQTETVDYYPNCDGEYDRYGTEWVTKRSVSLNLEDNNLKIDS